MFPTPKIPAPSRRMTVLLASVLALIGVGWAPATTPRAAAVSVDVECVGSFSRTFDPPISMTPQQVTVTGTNTYGPCVVGPTATGTTVRTATLSCVPIVPGVPPDTETITWLDGTGDTTTVLWSNATVVGQTVVTTGLVTAGRHLGDSATKVTTGISYVGSVAGCLLGTPISSTSGLIDSLLLTR